MQFTRASKNREEHLQCAKLVTGSFMNDYGTYHMGSFMQSMVHVHPNTMILHLT